MWWHLTWKNFHVGNSNFSYLSFTILFSFFFLASLLSSQSIQHSSSFFDAANLKTRSSKCPPSIQSSNQPDQLTQRSIVQSTKSSHRSSSVLWSSRSFLFKSILPLFFFRSVFLCSSSNMFFVKYKNRVLETQFCFLELESTRLKIYVASYVQLTKWESSF